MSADIAPARQEVKSPADMLQDTNRVAIFTPGASDPAAAPSLVGTGSDGTTYWNVFNLEGESATLAYFATYATLTDMLLDQNRTGVFAPNGSGAASRLVGTGAGFAVTPPGTMYRGPGRCYWSSRVSSRMQVGAEAGADPHLCGARRGCSSRDFR